MDFLGEFQIFFKPNELRSEIWYILAILGVNCYEKEYSGAIEYSMGPKMCFQIDLSVDLRFIFYGI